jgi:hypothetical protein
MDIRLQRLLPGERTRRLLQSDLPVVAQALTLALRGRAVTHVGVTRGQNYIWISGERVSLTIQEEDWLKIRPFLEDGSFDPSVVPSGFAGVDMWQDPLYQRVLDTLTPIFTEDFPHE